MGAALDLLRPSVSLGFCNFLVDVKVESVYEWVGGVGGAEMITLPYELDCGGREVRNEVWDVTSGNEMFSGGEEGFAELGFTGTCRGGELKLSEGLPVRFPQVGEGDAGNLGGL